MESFNIIKHFKWLYEIKSLHQFVSLPATTTAPKYELFVDGFSTRYVPAENILLLQPR